MSWESSRKIYANKLPQLSSVIAVSLTHSGSISDKILRFKSDIKIQPSSARTHTSSFLTSSSLNFFFRLDVFIYSCIFLRNENFNIGEYFFNKLNAKWHFLFYNENESELNWNKSSRSSVWRTFNNFFLLLNSGNWKNHQFIKKSS